VSRSADFHIPPKDVNPCHVRSFFVEAGRLMGPGR